MGQKVRFLTDMRAFRVSRTKWADTSYSSNWATDRYFRRSIASKLRNASKSVTDQDSQHGITEKIVQEVLSGLRIKGRMSQTFVGNPMLRQAVLSHPVPRIFLDARA